MSRRWRFGVLGAVIAVAVVVVTTAVAGLVGFEAWVAREGRAAVDARPASAAGDDALVQRGRYLARIGNCLGCHTARGGEPYAGGRAIATPFGTFYGPNLTPDAATGLGAWNADDFWRALHEGRSRDGRALYPAFPYPNYTRVTRADSDAIFAFLRSLPPVEAPARPHALRFPFDQRALLPAWRALFFRPGVQVDDPSRDARWNRGAYLVEGLGHCGACHAPRNVLGATRESAGLAGARIPMVDWYAPPLTSQHASGLGDWTEQDLVDLLVDGTSARGAAVGPMAEVVSRSLQYLADGDARAIAAYLKALPAGTPADAPGSGQPASTAADSSGAALYREHCQDCHSADGRGRPPAVPPLVGNPSVVAVTPINAVRVVLWGGFAPGTRGNPRPHGMPPYGPTLDDAQVAAVVGYVRAAWGNGAGAPSSAEVARWRTAPTD